VQVKLVVLIIMVTCTKQPTNTCSKLCKDIKTARHAAHLQVPEHCQPQWFMGTSLRPLCGSSIPARARSNVSLLVSTNSEPFTPGIHAKRASGGTLNTWRSGDDGRAVAERSLVRF
jgi:hypothetical protein